MKKNYAEHKTFLDHVDRVHLFSNLTVFVKPIIVKGIVGIF